MNHIKIPLHVQGGIFIAKVVREVAIRGFIVPKRRYFFLSFGSKNLSKLFCVLCEKSDKEK
jgi:hypothetical protein